MIYDKKVISETNLMKLMDLKNPDVIDIVEKYTLLCKPSKVTVITDSREDIDYVKKIAVEKKEEQTLTTPGHTVHFDGYYDQGRDKDKTAVLITPHMKMSKGIRTGDRNDNLMEMMDLLDGSMKGKEALVRFFCLGPLDSKFSICAMQITDSAYVGHSEDLLYRAGYEQFKKLRGSNKFFYFIHTAGELDDRGNSIDKENKRIYIDLLGNRVFTVNSQYAGNSLGLKKLALRLAIFRSNHEDWLTEHMFIMGVRPENKGRITYFTGAFPSACGKTSTAMIPGQLIVGDDIAYIRRGNDGKPYAANIEQGIFGIIEDVNPVDDPLIYSTLTSPREIIFSNILVKDRKPYWLGMGTKLPEEGENHFGTWKLGQKDPEGNAVTAAHKNARYTLRLSELENCDPRLNDPHGLPVSGVIYGGRDSDTSVPVYQSFDWTHGVFIGATLESETTAATLGASGVRAFQPMANIDFLVVPLGLYIRNHLKFGESLKAKPLVFGTNYFLKEDGKFLNEKVDKKVWLLWMEGRVHNEYDAIKTPIGFIPKYEDIRDLFKKIFNRDYTKEQYTKGFSLRCSKYIEKIERMEEIYRHEEELPKEFTEIMKKIKDDVSAAMKKAGKEIIPPEEFIIQ